MRLEATTTIEMQNTKKIFLALSFPLLYKGTRDIEGAKMREGPFEEFFQVPFHQEVDDKNIPQEIKDCLDMTLSEVVPFRGDDLVCEELVKILRDEKIIDELKENGILNFPKENEQEEILRNIVSRFGILD